MQRTPLDVSGEVQPVLMAVSEVHSGDVSRRMLCTVHMYASDRLPPVTR